MIRNISISLCLIFLCACGSKTTVILLPEKNGTTGSVVVKNQRSSTILSKPYTYTRVSDDTSDFPVKSIDQNKVKEQYQLLLEAEPAKPVHFTLYFKHNSTNLTKESRELILKILKVAKEREPSEISVIGHTDSKGSPEYNKKLSLERAKSVEKILKKSDTSLKNLYVKSHGENDPLVLTGDNVSEEKNRRVEVMIR
ncbi:MAG: OmpA family protein [Desulfobacteraceae bacterium]|nr:OmpA family protein [Desulfobacteraceae bacterium]